MERKRSQLRQFVLGFSAQALIWIALTVAFAGLLRLAGSPSWVNALRFAALNWLPWVVLTPAVFWLSRRFPLERSRLWISIPVHVVGCALCVALTVWLSVYVEHLVRPPMGRFEDHRGFAAQAMDREPPPRPEGSGTPPGPGTAEPGSMPPAFSRFDRSEGFPRDGRPPFPRRTIWTRFFGATLMRANFDAAVYLIVVVAAHALAFYRRAQEREQHAIALTAGLNRAKLDALRLQLQPHFLFNTLNAISTLVHRDAGAADELIGDLSELLRLSLQTAEHEVPLARELELLDRYLAIEKTRLGDRLQVHREIEPGTESALVPTFLLQPVVENAIRHGIEPRVAPGKITIHAHRENGSLVIVVSDDGIGLRNAPTAHRGIGLSNTEQRLRTLHGGAASLAISTPAAGGVTVKIVLPFSTISKSGVLGAAPLEAAGRETT